MAFGLLLSTAARAEENGAGQAPEEAPPARIEGSRDGEGAAREVRPALARRKRNALNQFNAKAAPFDPKVFEARGRELHGQYYEIAGAVQPSPWDAATPGQAPAPSAGTGGRAGVSRQWMIWTGAAGLAALVGGSVGYLMLVQHNAPEPLPVHLDDKP